MLPSDEKSKKIQAEIDKITQKAKSNSKKCMSHYFSRDKARENRAEAYYKQNFISRFFTRLVTSISKDLKGYKDYSIRQARAGQALRALNNFFKTMPSEALKSMTMGIRHSMEHVSSIKDDIMVETIRAEGVRQEKQISIKIDALCKTFEKMNLPSSQINELRNILIESAYSNLSQLQNHLLIPYIKTEAFEHAKILGLNLPLDVTSPAASSKRQLDIAYKKQAVLLHPDKQKGTQEAEENFKALGNAKEFFDKHLPILTDPLYHFIHPTISAHPMASSKKTALTMNKNFSHEKKVLPQYLQNLKSASSKNFLTVAARQIIHAVSSVLPSRKSQPERAAPTPTKRH